MMRTWAVTFVVSASLFAVLPAFAQEAALPPSIASVGVTQLQWDAVRRDVRAQARRAGVAEAALLAAAESTGASLARSGRFSASSLRQTIFDQLTEQADQIAELQRRLDALGGDPDSTVAEFFAQARSALSEGRLSDADRYLEQVAQRDLDVIQQADAEVDARRLRAGETMANRGLLAYLLADLTEAAAHFERAANTVPPSAIQIRWRYQVARAAALRARAERFSEPMRLREAVSILQDESLPLAERTTHASEWATTQHELAETWSAAARQGDSAASTRAIIAYEAALEVRDRVSDFSGWLNSQTGLASVLITLGDRNDTQYLHRSIVILQRIIDGDTRARAPEAWARVQSTLGRALQILGERGDQAALQRSIEAFEAALQVQTQEGEPREWVVTKVNLGNALVRLGQRREDHVMVARAASQYSSALQALTREGDPARWASVQSNLGVALELLGRRGDDQALRRAIIAYEAALEVSAPEQSPMSWANTQVNLGNVFRVLGERGDDVALGRSVGAHEAALRVFTRNEHPVPWAQTNNNLGNTLRVMADRSAARGLPARALYDRALDHFRAASEVLTQQQSPNFARTIASNIVRAERGRAAARH